MLKDRKAFALDKLATRESVQTEREAKREKWRIKGSMPASNHSELFSKQIEIESLYRDCLISNGCKVYTTYTNKPRMKVIYATPRLRL